MNHKIHNVTLVKAEDETLLLVVAGQAYRMAWTDCSLRLARANKTERALIEVSPSGYGLHWPLIDEDLAITPLLETADSILLESITTTRLRDHLYQRSGVYDERDKQHDGVADNN
jgi:hypothetical protein